MAVAADPALELEPSLETARSLARDANVVPVGLRLVDDCETPVSAFLKLAGGDGGVREPCFLLESAEQGQVGRWSFLGFKPRSILRWADGRLAERGRDGGETVAEAPDPYAAVAERLGRLRLAPVSDLPPFTGGAVGFFGYDLVRTVEPLAEPNPDPLGLPDMALMICELMLAFDHQRHEVTTIAYAFCDDEGRIEAAHERAVGLIDEASEALRRPVPAPRRAA